MKSTLKLSEIKDNGAGILCFEGAPLTPSVYNIDDIFHFAQKNGIKKLELTFPEIQLVWKYLIANLSPSPVRDKLFIEGAPKRFLGVDIQEIYA